MKQFLRFSCIVFFIAGITAKDFAALGWNIWYTVNKTYVAEELCQNKARPELKCNGKCYLAKQLRKAEEPVPGSNAPERNLKLKSLDWIAERVVTAVDFSSSFETASRPSWPEQPSSLRSYAQDVFQPPAVLAS